MAVLAVMAGFQFTYIDSSRPPGKESARERELKRAIALSHAAAHSHKRRQQIRKSKKGVKEIACVVVPVTTQTRNCNGTGTFQQPPVSRCMPLGGSLIPPPISQKEDDSTFATCRRKAGHSALRLPNTVHRDRYGFQISPFDNLTEQEAPSIWTVMHFYQNNVAQSQTLVNDIFDIQSYDGSMFFQLLLHPDVRPSTIANFKIMLHQLTCPNQRPPRDIFENVGRGLANLQRRLKHGNLDEYTILASLTLARFAKSDGDNYSFEIHRASLKRLLTNVTGLDDNEPAKRTINRSVLQWESCWALERGIPSMFPEAHSPYVVYYPPYPFPPDVEPMVVKLPAGFQKLAKLGRLARDVLYVLTRAADADQISRETSKEFMLSHRQSFYTDRTTLRQHATIWDACPSMRSTVESNGRSSLNRLVVLALVLYSFNNFCPHRTVNIQYRTARKVLGEDIRKMIPFPESERNILVWLGMNATDAWGNDQCILSSEGLQILGLMKTCFADLSVQALKGCLRQFLCADEFERRCEAFWKAGYIGPGV